MGYKVLIGDTYQELNESVNEHISKGWRPKGSHKVHVVSRENRQTYQKYECNWSQTMILNNN